MVVTLNPPFEPDPSKLLREFEYWHPLLDTAAVTAQQGIVRMQGLRHTWYAGAWLGYGFHEDGLRSAHAVAKGEPPMHLDYGPPKPLVAEYMRNESRFRVVERTAGGYRETRLEAARFVPLRAGKG